MTYYYFVVSNANRQQMIDNYGNIQNADLEYLKYCAQSAGYDLNFYLGQILAKGPVTKDARDIAQGNLTPNTVYYAYCYGMNSDGSFTTDVYEQEFSTGAVTLRAMSPDDRAAFLRLTRQYRLLFEQQLRTLSSQGGTPPDPAAQQ